jgi:tetratricopeptide (TPR) repeat protein
LLLLVSNLLAESLSYEIDKAKNEIKNENYQAAETILKKLVPQIEDKSCLPEVYFLLSQCVETSKQADFFCEKILALSENSYSDKARLALAKNCYCNFDHTKAELYLNEILQHPSGSCFKDAVYWTAQNYFSVKDYTNSVNYFERYLAIGNDPTQLELSMLNLGTAHFKMDNFSAALKQYQNLKNSGKNTNFSPFLLYMMGLSYEKLSQYEEAITRYKRVINQYPYSEQRALAESLLVRLAERGLYSPSLKMPEVNTDFEKKYIVQLAAFLQKERAETSYEEFRKKGYDAFVYEKQVKGKHYFAVGLGPYKTEAEAKYIQKKLKKKGISSYIYKKS